ncbi:IS30 family transposase [Agromyces ramosus]|uniref:IS30 family transposase n=1 Tax=Agromyces ramosus TaxID=33879 RepID=A0ABU0R9R4_9MICO|nr:IS30 family transposase [Agromyces ramosus]
MPGSTLRWLRQLTGETSTREIGKHLGRSHATIQRWAKYGIPPRAVLQLVAEHGIDLYDTLEALGWLSSEDRAKIAPHAEQLPTEVLAAEVHRLAGVVHERVTDHEDEC